MVKILQLSVFMIMVVDSNNLRNINLQYQACYFCSAKIISNVRTQSCVKNYVDCAWVSLYRLHDFYIYLFNCAFFYLIY